MANEAQGRMIVVLRVASVASTRVLNLVDSSQSLPSRSSAPEFTGCRACLAGLWAREGRAAGILGAPPPLQLLAAGPREKQRPAPRPHGAICAAAITAGETAEWARPHCRVGMVNRPLTCERARMLIRRHLVEEELSVLFGR